MARAKTTFGLASIDSDKSFPYDNRSANKSLNACHQICNSNKHFHLNSPVKEFKIMVGEILVRRGDGETDLGVVLHVTRNGEGTDGQGSIEDMLLSLISFWEEALTSIGVPGREQFYSESRK